MFVTLQCLVFDVAARRITGASAGHHAAVGVTPGQPPRLVFTTSGRVLGLIPGGTYTSETHRASRPVKRSWRFTDGVSEAFGPAKSCSAKTACSRISSASPGDDARETSLGVLDAVRRHAAGTKQSDDITIVSVRHTDGATT